MRKREHPYKNWEKEDSQQTLLEFKRTLKDFVKAKGLENPIGATGGVETELDTVKGIAWAELWLMNNPSDTGYVEMRSNTEDWGDVTGIPTIYRALIEGDAHLKEKIEMTQEFKDAPKIDFGTKESEKPEKEEPKIESEYEIRMRKLMEKKPIITIPNPKSEEEIPEERKPKIVDDEETEKIWESI